MMSLSESYHLLARSPLGRALEHYIQHGIALDLLRRLTLRLCYWYQSMTGRQTTALDVHIYRRTRITLEELRHAYIIWQRHRYPCRCGCEVNNADFGAFSLAVDHLRDWGWLGEGSEDDLWMDDRDPEEILADDMSNGLVRRSRYSSDTMRRGREQRPAFTLENILPNSSTDESVGNPHRERSPNENQPGLSPLRYSGDALMSRRRGEAINSRSQSSPPDPSIEQRNSPAISSTDFRRSRGRFAHGASRDRGNCRNISTASLMNRIMERSDANWSNLNWRDGPSSNISRMTSRRSRGSSWNGRGMRGPPNLATGQRTVGNSHAPLRINTRTRSGSLGSSMADSGTLPIRPTPDARRLAEQFLISTEAEHSRISAEASDILNELEVSPPNSYGDLAHRWRRVTLLMSQIRAMRGQVTSLMNQI